MTLAASQTNHVTVRGQPLLEQCMLDGTTDSLEWERGGEWWIRSGLPLGTREKQRLGLVYVQLQPELCVFLNPYWLEISFFILLTPFLQHLHVKTWY